jgi:hypothetical protein
MSMEEKWDPSDHQGRRQDQTQRNYRILAFTIIFMWLYAFGMLLYESISYLF